MNHDLNLNNNIMKNLKKIIASSLSVISLAISAQNVIPKMSIVRESTQIGRASCRERV